MNSLSSEIGSILSGVCPRVSYFYPASWAALPCVAWRESGNRVAARADGGEHLTELAYTVDIWSDSPGVNAELAAQVDARMAAAHLLRVYSADLFESGTRLHHRVLRYRVLYDGRGRYQ